MTPEPGQEGQKEHYGKRGVGKETHDGGNESASSTGNGLSSQSLEACELLSFFRPVSKCNLRVSRVRPAGCVKINRSARLKRGYQAGWPQQPQHGHHQDSIEQGQHQDVGEHLSIPLGKAVGEGDDLCKSQRLCRALWPRFRPANSCAISTAYARCIRFDFSCVIFMTTLLFAASYSLPD